MAGKILDLLYPPVCPFCEKIISKKDRGESSGHGICQECRKRISYIKEPRCMKCGKPVSRDEQEYCFDCARHKFAYDQGRALWIHRGDVSRAIYQFKFHNKRYYAKIFAKEMANQYAAWIKERGVEEIIPVPLHPSKRRGRGFNQAVLLAEELGHILEIPVNKNVVFRIRRTKPQKQLNDSERTENMQGAFGVSKRWNPRQAVLLIDDIYTTGNTVHRMAKVLKKAGVQKVYFLSISIGQGL